MDSNKKEDYKNWGKRGGRPELKHLKRTERLYISFTVEEMSFLKQEASSKKFDKVLDYARFVLLDKKLPNFERDKILISYANNFKKISNYMQMGIFNESEKKRLIDEINNVIFLIRNRIEWL